MIKFRARTGEQLGNPDFINQWRPLPANNWLRKDHGTWQQILNGYTVPEITNLARQALQQGEDYLRVWSVGCGSGEEPYTISLLWRLQMQSQFPGLSLRLIATDTNPVMRQRVADACYAYSSVKNLPAGWCEKAFTQDVTRYCLKPEFRSSIQFMQQDVRETNPTEIFDLVLCRNLVFTYFEEDLQRSALDRLRVVLKPDGALVIGIHERLPEGVGGFSKWSAKLRVYRKAG